jgi:hypothetical protein
MAARGLLPHPFNADDAHEAVRQLASPPLPATLALQADLEKADEFEAAYNFRFEDPSGGAIVTHARNVGAGLVRAAVAAAARQGGGGGGGW